jgi:hypothetical protein
MRLVLDILKLVWWWADLSDIVLHLCLFSLWSPAYTYQALPQSPIL